jgi:hypothetical protein
MYSENFFDYRQYGPVTLDHDRKNSVYHPLNPDDLIFSENAKFTLNEAIEKIAQHVNINPHELNEKLNRNYFLMEPSGFLIILIQIEEIEAEMYVEIPADHWWVNKERLA